MKIISFFNHKGGVGKTTLAFNIALAMAEAGNTVLLIDVDAQSNLSQLSFDQDRMLELLEDDRTIWSILSPLVTGAGDIADFDPELVRPSVYAVPGDLRLSRFEEICPEGWTSALAGQERGFRVSTAIYRIARKAGQIVGADYVLMDLGPNVGALNRTAVLASDAFVVPMAPDLFSVRALPSVGESVATWIREWRIALEVLQDDLAFEVPTGMPAPLGYVSQQFSVYRSGPSEAFRKWIDRIPEAYTAGIQDKLAAMDIPVLRDHDPYLASVPNFQSLVPIAQEANKAIYELSGDEARGAQYTRAQETKEVFSDLAQTLIDRVAL